MAQTYQLKRTIRDSDTPEKDFSMASWALPPGFASDTSRESHGISLVVRFHIRDVHVVIKNFFLADSNCKESGRCIARIV